MSILKVGEISNDVSLIGKRDAVHVPVILVTSNMTLKAGQNVKFSNKEMTLVEFCAKKDRQAIVDPFIENTLVSGDIFHVLLEPSLVTNLTHQFDIASIDKIEEVEDLDECAGCYGGHIVDEDDEVEDVDDEEYNSCRGCY